MNKQYRITEIFNQLLVKQLVFSIITVSVLLIGLLYFFFFNNISAAFTQEFDDVVQEIQYILNKPIDYSKSHIVSHISTNTIEIKYLEALIDSKNFIDSIIILKNGKIANIALPAERRGDRSLFIGNDIGQFYHSSPDSHRTEQWSGISSSIVSGRPITYFSLEADNFTILTLVDLDLFRHWLSMRGRFSNSSIIIADDKGDPLYVPGHFRVEQRQNISNLISTDTPSGKIYFQKIDHQFSAIFKNFLPGSTWTVLIYQPFYAVVRDALFISIAIICVVAFTLALSTILYKRFITKLLEPLPRVEEQLSSIAEGRYALSPPIHTGVLEIDLLQQRIHTMGSILLSRENELCKRINTTKTEIDEKTQFLARISHSIRNPLNNILGYFPLIWTNCGQDEAQTYRENVEHNLEKLDTIINLILSHDSFDLSKTSLHYESFPLTHFLELLIDRFHISTNRAFQLKTDPELTGKYIRGDKNKFELIISYILDDAYLKSTSGALSISLDIEHYAHSPSDMVQIGVRISYTPDNNNELIANISENTDIELKIAEQYIEQMSGRIYYSIGPKKEQIIICTLPFFVNIETERPDSQEELPLLNILIVDDEISNRELTKLYLLHDKQHTITLVGDGSEAVEQTLHNTYDIIFMDIQMPILDGISATKKIRELGVTTPIIAISAHGFDEHVMEARLAGMNDFLVKPVKSQQLISAMKRQIFKPA